MNMGARCSDTYVFTVWLRAIRLTTQVKIVLFQKSPVQKTSNGLSRKYCSKIQSTDAVCQSYDAHEASTVFKVVNSHNKGVCVSSTASTDSQYREVRGHNASRDVQMKRYYTKCFYNSNVDKKRVIGLLVKGNKAKNLASKGVKIPMKVYH